MRAAACHFRLRGRSYGRITFSQLGLANTALISDMSLILNCATEAAWIASGRSLMSLSGKLWSGAQLAAMLVAATGETVNMERIHQMCQEFASLDPCLPRFIVFRKKTVLTAAHRLFGLQHVRLTLRGLQES